MTAASKSDTRLQTEPVKVVQVLTPIILLMAGARASYAPVGDRQRVALAAQKASVAA